MRNVNTLLNQSRLDAVGTEADRCEIFVDDDIPPFKVDQEYLAHTMRHLLDNAVKFSDPDSPIIIRASHENGQIIISVQDVGRGIPAEEIPKIWDMFYQVRREFYEDQGSGSGLAIVKGLIEMHGGWVDVESVLEEGSIFYIRLPIT
jgi:signal transduction histidine kinase